MHETHIKQQAWGVTRAGQAVQFFTLSNERLTVCVSNFGARIVRILAPDRDGTQADVALGYDDLASYEADSETYLGAIVGRVANRIAKGTFLLDGQSILIPVNDNGNALHGGPQGFDRKVWSAEVALDAVVMTLVSPDQDMGFPGTLTMQVRYGLEGNSLSVHFSATTDKRTVVNLTNHCYFNLAGEASGTVLDHMLRINADHFTPVDNASIPLGPHASVIGTPFDFRTPALIGARLQDSHPQLALTGGYDHNFVVNEADGSLKLVAEVSDAASGRTLTVHSTEPGIQFYAGNSLAGKFAGLTGQPYAKHAGFCLETQHFPDTPNHPQYPSIELQPEETYQSRTSFTFAVAS